MVVGMDGGSVRQRRWASEMTYSKVKKEIAQICKKH